MVDVYPPSTPNDRATALVYDVTRKGAAVATAKLVWKGPLSNDMAPIDVVITNHGNLVTFDTWGQMGFDDSIVVYDRCGKLLASHHLDTLMPKELADRGRSISSREWRRGGAYAFDQDVLYLHIPDGLFEVALADGKATFTRNSPKPIPAKATSAGIKSTPVQRGTRTESGAACKPK